MGKYDQLLIRAVGFSVIGYPSHIKAVHTLNSKKDFVLTKPHCSCGQKKQSPFIG